MPGQIVREVETQHPSLKGNCDEKGTPLVEIGSGL
jgi:hypothetical protein